MKKLTYSAPEIKAVEFKVEAGFNNSIQARDGQGLTELLGGNGQNQTQQHFGRMTGSDGEGSTWGTFN